MNETEQVIDGLDEVEIANTSIDEIDSENINLIFVGIDKSGSMGMYERDMVKALSDFKDALINSKECDEILVARADFSDSATVGGYKRITEFDTSYSTEFAIFGDGMDNSSQPGGFAKAKKAVEYLNVEEIVTAFISFGGQATQEAKDLGFKNILDVSSSASELRRAFNCLSKSVIENSKSAVSKQDDFFDV